MVFPFTFSFSVPGIFNPFGTYSSASDKPGSSSTSDTNKKRIRTHQSPMSDSCHTNTIGSQDSEYQDRIPAPAYPSPSTYPASSSFPIPVAPATAGRRISRSQLPRIPRRHSPSPSPSSLRALPLSRKRGWEPAFGADSIQSLGSIGKSSSTASLTFVSSSGYLDSPAKYRDMADDITMSDDHYRESVRQHDDYDDVPPMKKRRGLAGSIVSTAVSAALIGTAVGLTVYRLWRDRGKEGQITDAPSQSESQLDPDKQIPPPPYDAGHWRAVDQPVAIPVSASQPRAAPVTPGTPRNGKGKRVGAKRAIPVHSARRTRTPKQGGALGGFGSPRTRPEFDFSQAPLGEESLGQGPQTEVEDKMDWIGDKLTLLIEQGRRALQSEVVVMSEAKEDEVDDGRGGWEEEADEGDDSEFDDDAHSRYGRSRSDSVRSGNTMLKSQRPTASRPRNIAVPTQSNVGLGMSGVNTSPYPSGSLSASPRRSGFTPGSGLSAYATPSTSHTITHASAGFAPSSSVPSPFYSATVGYGSPSRAGSGHVRGISYESGLSSFGGSSNEESAGWESPEIRESMERARARLLARRNGVSGV